MTDILMLILPEALLFATVLLLFLSSAAQNHLPVPAAGKWLPLACLVIVAGAVFSLSASATLLSGTYTVDGLSQFFKLLVAFGFLAAVCNAAFRLSMESWRENDYFLFLGFSALGLMLLCSCSELMTLYIALELGSYSLYVLIPMRDNMRESAEAGAKYILFGAAATAVSLFGLSLIMASTGTTFVAGLRETAQAWQTDIAALMGICLFLCGFFYKLALFPFHFWCPDVYQGASNETAAYSATLPKLGAMVVLIRLASALEPGGTFTNILAGLALVSMTFGNLCALAQKDIKRLLGYSSVAHAGYIMTGICAGSRFSIAGSHGGDGFAAAAFYSLAYLVMNLAVFWVICRVAADGRNLKVEDLKGLSKKSPALAFTLAVGAFALVGLPPFIGFSGKLFLILAAWRNYWWLVIGITLNSAIAIFYYLNLVRHAYAEDPAPETPDSPKAGPDNSFAARAGALILAALAVLLGVLPGPVYSYLLEVTKKLL